MITASHGQGNLQVSAEKSTLGLFRERAVNDKPFNFSVMIINGGQEVL